MTQLRRQPTDYKQHVVELHSGRMKANALGSQRVSELEEFFMQILRPPPPSPLPHFFSFGHSASRLLIDVLLVGHKRN